MEIELVNLKDRERLGGLTSIRLAASYKNGHSIFPKSYIDETGNFRPVDFKETRARDEETLNSPVKANTNSTGMQLSRTKAASQFENRPSGSPGEPTSWQVLYRKRE